MGDSVYRSRWSRNWMGTFSAEDMGQQHQPQPYWMDPYHPFAEIRPPQPHAGRILRDSHGHPLSASEFEDHSAQSRRRAWPPLPNNIHRRNQSFDRHEDEKNDFYLPLTRRMLASELESPYQALWPSPIIHPYQSTIQTVQQLSHEQPFTSTYNLRKEMTTSWEHWPPESLSRRRKFSHLLHPFLTAAIDCPEESSSIWDMLDFPIAAGMLMRWTPNGHRIPVKEKKELEGVATFPPVKLLVIYFNEGIPPLEIAKKEDGKEITLKDVLLALHGHLNGGKAGRGYVSRAAFQEFDDELKALTMWNCDRRRHYLYSEQDSRHVTDPPKWIDVLRDSATKFVRLVPIRGNSDDMILCKLESAPGKIHRSQS